MKSKRLVTVIIALLAAALIGIVGFILFKNYNNQRSKEKYNSVASSYANNATDSTEKSSENNGKEDKTNPTKALPKNPIDFKGLTDRNPDIYGWIKIPNTNVDYPVIQSPTNDNFYLDHDLDGNYAFAGSIYSQLCNRRNFQDRVTLLYGHNMLDGSMFATIYRFADPSFFKKNKSMTIYTDDTKLDYTIVSAFEYDDRHIMNSFNFSNNKSYQSFIDEVINPRSVTKNVRTGETVTTNDKIVVLSTCVNSGEGRYLVVGKLTKQTELQKSN